MGKFLLYSLLILMVSCKKLVDLPEENGPQFQSKMLISIFQNNEWQVIDSVKVTAGDLDAYYDVSTEIRNGVKVYIGEFNFENNTKKLKFEYYDHSSTYDYNEGKPLLNSDLRFSDFTTAYIGYLTLDSNKIHGQNLTDWRWTIDGVHENGSIHNVSEPGIYNVTLETEFNGTTVSSLENQIYLGFENPCWGYFETHDLGSGHFEFISFVQNTDATVEWEIDGITYAQESVLLNLNQGVHKVRMNVRDSDGNHYFREKNVGHNATNFVESFNFVKPIGKDLHNTLIVSYENNGVVYSSKHVNQINPFVSIGDEKLIMESNSHFVSQYMVDLSFDMINIENLQDPLLKINLQGEIGFEVEK